MITIDAVVPSGNSLHGSKPSDILMMILVEGRERTEEEFHVLYKQAGLKVTKIVPTASTLCVVEGVRA